MELTKEKEILISPYAQLVDGVPPGPNPTQQRILDWVDKVVQEHQSKEDPDHIPVLYLQGGVGSGKSRGIMAPVIELLTMFPGIRILWGRMDFKDIKLSIMDKFFEVMPPELITGKSLQYNWFDIGQEGNSPGRIYFNGLKDLSGFGSQEFGVIVITEAHETTENVYRTLKRRCRQINVPCLFLMEGEPPNEDHYLVKLTDPESDSYDPDVEKWEISTFENWDNLPKAYRGSLETMPEAWKRKYLYGKAGFIPDGKPYYHGFMESFHTGHFEAVEARPLILGWDFGYHHPAVVITQIDNQDRWIWLREIMGSDITIDKFGDMIIQILNEYYPGMSLVHYGDPAVIQVNDKSEYTSWQILKQKGININHKPSNYRERKEIIEKKLATINNKKPAIMIDSRHCRTAIDGFLGGYHYPERKPGQEAGTRFDQPYRDGFYEHVMNAGEYIAVNMFKPIEKDAKLSLKRRVAVHDMKKRKNGGISFGSRR